MRSVTRAAVTPVIALVVVVTTAGTAWATFQSTASSSRSISTLTLQPPGGEPTEMSCVTEKKGPSTLVVGFPDSASEADLANRSGPAPATALGYSATATYTQTTGKKTTEGSTSGSVAASGGTSNTISLSTSGVGPSTWSVSVITTYSGWTSTAVTNTTPIPC